MKTFIRKDIRSVCFVLALAIFLFFLVGVFIVDLSSLQRFGWILSMISSLCSALVFGISLAEAKPGKRIIEK